jgi:large subunit ribosomal protein L16
LFKNKKMWFFLLPNYILSKKSKNSRMGKGKGSIRRWIIRIHGGSILLEFKGVSNWRIITILNKIQQRIKVKLKFFTKEIREYNSSTNNSITHPRKDFFFNV